MVYATDEEVDEYGFRNEDFVKATLYQPSVALAEENRILRAELELVKKVNHFVLKDCKNALTVCQQHNRLLHAERRLHERCVSLPTGVKPRKI